MFLILPYQWCHLSEYFGHRLFVVVACFKKLERFVEVQLGYNYFFSYVLWFGCSLQRRFMDIQIFIRTRCECVLLSLLIALLILDILTSFFGRFRLMSLGYFFALILIISRRVAFHGVRSVSKRLLIWLRVLQRWEISWADWLMAKYGGSLSLFLYFLLFLIISCLR